MKIDSQESDRNAAADQINATFTGATSPKSSDNMGHKVGLTAKAVFK